MKKYCLSEEAKNDFKEIWKVIYAVLVILAMTIMTTGALALPFVEIKNNFDLVMLSLGALGWAVALPYVAIYFKRYLQNNLEEC